MKFNEIINETTAGAVATVAMPLGKTQKRGGNLLTGKKTNKKYANSVYESKMKQLAMDLKDMDNGNFQKKYKKSKEQMKMELGDPHSKKTVHEAHLEEDDLILVPGQGHRLKSGFIPHDKDRTDHEVEMAKSDLFQAAKNAKQVYEMIADVSEDEGLEGWVQEKIIKANDYLNTIREYLEGKQLQHNEMTGGVIAGGARNFEEGIGGTLKQVGKGISDRIKPMTKKSHEEKWYLSGYTLSEKPLGAGMGRANYFTTNNEFPSKKEALDYIKEKQAKLNSYGKVGYFSLFVKSSERYFTGEPLFSKIEDPNKEEKVDEEGKQLKNEMSGGVIAAGGVGESLANWNMGVQSIPRTSEWKRKAITAVMPGAMGKEYTFDTEQEAIQHFGKDAWEKIKAGVPTKSGKPWEVIYADDVTEGIGEKIKGAIRREKAKDLPLVQTRRDYAMGKGGEAYNKGETRKGNQYMAWAEKDRKKQGAPTTNPAGTYRTKTSDYTNEGALVDNLYKVRYKNTETGETKDIKIRAPSSKEAREQAESDYTHDSRVWKCLGTKEITNEAQSMGTALKNTLAKAEPGSKLDNSIKSHNRNIKSGGQGTLKNAPTGYHFDKKGYCRLGDTA